LRREVGTLAEKRGGLIGGGEKVRGGGRGKVFAFRWRAETGRRKAGLKTTGRGRGRE